MAKLLLFLALGLGALAPPAACLAQVAGSPTPCVGAADTATAYPNASALRALLRRAAQAGIPGAALAVYSPAAGYWTGTAGYARLETQTPMQPCHLQYGQSVTKLYLAVLMLRLYQEGRLAFDAPITRYLPVTVSQRLPNASQLTVRMLLNHTSGLPDYATNDHYVSYLLAHPLHQFSSQDYLGYVAGDTLRFAPGSRFAYSNTNYLVLALLADQLTGNHARYLQRRILAPMGLRHTFYHDTPAYLQSPSVVDSYWDRTGAGKPENVTQMQRVNVASMQGDDGVVATPLDYVRFLRALFEGQLLRPAAQRELLHWVKDPVTGQAVYSMGLYHSEYAGQVAYGHGGGGIGAGCGLYYLPQKQLYVFLGVNLGVLTEGPLVQRAAELRDAVLAELVH